MQDDNLIDDANDRGTLLVGLLSLVDSMRVVLSEGLDKEMKVSALTHGQQVYKLLLTGQFRSEVSDPKTSA